VVTWEQKSAIEDFLYREAMLLDEYRYEEWLALFTEDAEYLVPLREQVQGDVEPAGHPLIKDDKTMLMTRIAKDATGLAHVEVPRSMTSRVISNVIVDDGASPDEVRVFCNFVVRQARKLRDEAWWVGRRRDVLRRVDGSWKIARREVILDTSILPRGISIFF
jgi:3-phenylpropionate/cinnamic acid dioxygenase small subunit